MSSRCAKKIGRSYIKQVIQSHFVRTFMYVGKDELALLTYVIIDI